MVDGVMFPTRRNSQAPLPVTKCRPATRTKPPFRNWIYLQWVSSALGSPGKSPSFIPLTFSLWILSGFSPVIPFRDPSTIIPGILSRFPHGIVRDLWIYKLYSDYVISSTSSINSLLYDGKVIEWSLIRSVNIRVINKIERPRSGSLIC